MENTVIIKRKWFRRVAAALFLSFLLSLMFTAVTSAAMIPFSVKTTTDNLNIRMQPDTYSSILTVIEKKDTGLYPVEELEKWYKIRFANNIYGYVYKKFTTTGDAFPTTIKLFPGATIRTSNSETAEKQCVCSAGTEVNISASDENWYMVTAFNGESGYILKSSVKEPAPPYPNINSSSVNVDVGTLLKANSANTTIRSGAGSGYDRIATVAAGALLSAIEAVTGSDGYTWYKVTVNGGKKGYVRSDAASVYPYNTALSGKIIVIDPGHGSYKTADSKTIDDGNIGVNGTLEKDINLKVSQLLTSYLQKAGATVLMTRNGDVGVMTLADRARTANDFNADIFISVHCNYSKTNSDKTGTITYYFGGNSSNKVSSELAAARKSFAGDIQTALVTEIAFEDLGTASDNFTVLVQTNKISILTELGYLSNAAEEALLGNENYQDYCAQGIFKGVLRYYE